MTGKFLLIGSFVWIAVLHCDPLTTPPPPLSFPVHVSQPDPPSSLKETSNRELTEEKRRRKLVYSGQIYTVCRLSVRNTVFV